MKKEFTSYHLASILVLVLLVSRINKGSGKTICFLLFSEKRKKKRKTIVYLSKRRTVEFVSQLLSFVIIHTKLEGKFERVLKRGCSVI